MLCCAASPSSSAAQRSVGTDLELDGHSLHGGCPVKNGTKWVMTKWIREKSTRYTGGY